MRALIFSILTIFFAGCASHSYNMSIYISPELQEAYGYYPSLEVDIVGLNDTEVSWMQNYRVEKYFEPNNPMRRTLMPATLYFNEDDGITRVDFESGDEIWDEWHKKGATQLMIAVNLPNTPDDGARKILRDVKSYYGARDYLYIEVRPVGITFLSSPPAYPTKAVPKPKSEPMKDYQDDF